MVINKKIIALLILFSSLIYVVYWGKENIPTQVDLCQQGVELYRNYEVQGSVIGKFVNNKNHNDKTVIIKDNNNQESIFILDADIGGVYDYIIVGDSLVKNSGELFLLVNRNNRDTIINFKFRCK